VSFDWTRALSPVCFLFIHNSMNFYVPDLLFCATGQCKQYGGHRRETNIVSDWKQAWNQFNN